MGYKEPVKEPARPGFRRSRVNEKIISMPRGPDILFILQSMSHNFVICGPKSEVGSL